MRDIYLISFCYPTNILLNNKNGNSQFYYKKDKYLTGKELLFLQRLIQEQNKLETKEELIKVLAYQSKKGSDESIILKELEYFNKMMNKFKEEKIIEFMKKGEVNEIHLNHYFKLLNRTSIYTNVETNESIHKSIINGEIIENEKYQLISSYITIDGSDLEESKMNIDFEDYLFFIAIQSSHNL